MHGDGIHSMGKILVIITLAGFFLPWVRISPESLKGNTMEVVRNLAEGGRNLGSTLVWMRGEEFREMWRDPADGFSGFQLAFADSRFDDARLGGFGSTAGALGFSSAHLIWTGSLVCDPALENRRRLH